MGLASRCSSQTGRQGPQGAQGAERTRSAEPVRSTVFCIQSSPAARFASPPTLAAMEIEVVKHLSFEDVSLTLPENMRLQAMQTDEPLTAADLKRRGRTLECLVMRIKSLCLCGPTNESFFSQSPR